MFAPHWLLGIETPVTYDFIYQTDFQKIGAVPYNIDYFTQFQHYIWSIQQMLWIKYKKFLDFCIKISQNLLNFYIKFYEWICCKLVFKHIFFCFDSLIFQLYLFISWLKYSTTSPFVNLDLFAQSLKQYPVSHLNLYLLNHSLFISVYNHVLVNCYFW